MWPLLAALFGAGGTTAGAGAAGAGAAGAGAAGAGAAGAGAAGAGAGAAGTAAGATGLGAAGVKAGAGGLMSALTSPTSGGADPLSSLSSMLQQGDTEGALKALTSMPPPEMTSSAKWSALLQQMGGPKGVAELLTKRSRSPSAVIPGVPQGPSPFVMAAPAQRRPLANLGMRRFGIGRGGL